MFRILAMVRRPSRAARWWTKVRSQRTLSTPPRSAVHPHSAFVVRRGQSALGSRAQVHTPSFLLLSAFLCMLHPFFFFTWRYLLLKGTGSRDRIRINRKKCIILDTRYKWDPFWKIFYSVPWPSIFKEEATKKRRSSLHIWTRKLAVEGGGVAWGGGGKG